MVDIDVSMYDKDGTFEIIAYNKDNEEERWSCDNINETIAVKALQAVTRVVKYWENKNDDDFENLRKLCHKAAMEKKNM